jgi:Flp pilus assembly protein TadG
MKRNWFTRVHREDGTALIEAAFTLPIMLLVCIGILEFGRAYQAWQVVTNASREGARVAVLPEYPDSSVTDRVKTYLKNGGLDPTAVDNTQVKITATTIPVSATTTASAANVSVEYPFKFMVLGPVAKLVVKDSKAGQDFTMVASTVMRNE